MTRESYVSCMTPTDALALAEAVARDGLEAHHDRVAGAVRLARAHGLCPALVDALDDPDGPPVARVRALGRIVVLLASTGRGPTTVGPGRLAVA